MIYFFCIHYNGILNQDHILHWLSGIIKCLYVIYWSFNVDQNKHIFVNTGYISVTVVFPFSYTEVYCVAHILGMYSYCIIGLYYIDNVDQPPLIILVGLSRSSQSCTATPMVVSSIKIYSSMISQITFVLTPYIEYWSRIVRNDDI